MKTNAQAIHIYSIGDDLYVAVEVEVVKGCPKEWIVIGKIYAPLREQTISYIYEPNARPMAAPKPSGVVAVKPSMSGDAEKLTATSKKTEVR